MTTTYQCGFCGKWFDRPHRKGRIHRFCSRKCAAQTAKAHHPNARKTRCKNGHEFTPENTGHRADGGRWCRACHNDVTARGRDLQQETHRRRQRYLNGGDDVRLIERKRTNDRSRDIATNHCKQWTGPELEIASRAELSNADVAVRTRRTIRAVETIRRRLKDDPRLYKMAGYA